MNYQGNHWYDWLNWDARQRGDVTHSTLGTPSTYGDASANRVITDDGGVFRSVGEYNGEQGWLNGGLDNTIDSDGNGIDPGDIIFWHTTADDGRRWNHWGVVQQEDPNHPNHS